MESNKTKQKMKKMGKIIKQKVKNENVKKMTKKLKMVKKIKKLLKMKND